MMHARAIEVPSVHEAIAMNTDSGNGDDDVNNMFKKPKSSVGRRLVTVKFADAMLDWVIFPLLLFVQFGTSMYCQQYQGTLHIQWFPTLTAITIFCIASVGYRKIFRAHPVQSIAALLIPELFTNIILATVMLADDLSTAVYTLIALTVVILVVAIIGQLQISQYRRFMPAPTANAYERLYDGNDDDDGDDGDDDDNGADEYLC
mmetsp:Transcript_4707/g.11446  ORF Transcript_4707/g.11446 Transcript_4707/m.11446 type:complete len:204 (-) Transcript_4707:2177-2788(-)